MSKSGKMTKKTGKLIYHFYEIGKIQKNWENVPNMALTEPNLILLIPISPKIVA